MSSSGNNPTKGAFGQIRKKGFAALFTEQYPLFRASGVLILISFALSIVLLRWMITDRATGFILGETSPRSYFALYPMSYLDDEGTRVLRSRVGETVAGVLVRDGAAMDRLIVKIEAMAKGDLAPLSLTTGLAELLKTMPEENRKKILTEAARISSDFLKNAGGDGLPIAPTPETIWKEIEKLSLPMEMNNVIFQILDEILQPLTRIDDDLTETLRGELAESLQPVERSVAPGDVLIEKGQTVTPQVARILKMQGYSQVTFPWKQILFALLALPFWPLWVLLQTSFRPSARQNIPWLYLSFAVGLSWVVEYFSSMFNIQGMGSLFLAGCAYLTLPPGLALPVVLGEASSAPSW